MRDRDEWMRRLGPLYPAAVALRQTTAVRWPPGLVLASDDLARSAPWMVAVGAAIGLCAWSAAWLLGSAGAAPAVGGAFALVAMAGLGALAIEAGVARRAELLGTGAGAAAIALLVLTRAVALLATHPDQWLGALVAAPLLGRWGALLVQRLGEPVSAGDRDLVVGSGSWTQVAVISAAVAIAAIVLVGWSALAAMIVAGGAAVGLGLDAERRDGRLGRDAIAAVAAAGELVLLVAAAAAHPAIASPFAT